MNVTTVGLDLAKNVFQVHGIDSTGRVIVRRSLRRRQMMPFFGKLEPCLRHRGVRHEPLLVPRAPGIGARGKINATDLRQTIRQAR